MKTFNNEERNELLSRVYVFDYCKWKRECQEAD